MEKTEGSEYPSIVITPVRVCALDKIVFENTTIRLQGNIGEAWRLIVAVRLGDHAGYLHRHCDEWIRGAFSFILYHNHHLSSTFRRNRKWFITEFLAYNNRHDSISKPTASNSKQPPRLDQSWTLEAFPTLTYYWHLYWDLDIFVRVSCVSSDQGLTGWLDFINIFFSIHLL